MRIGIDARIMSLHAGGIARYTLEMVQAVARLPEAAGHEFILYPGKMPGSVDLPANWTYSKRRIPSRGILRSLLYGLIARLDGLDAFYSADYLGPVVSMPCRSVITVHDLIPIVLPGVTSLQHRLVGSNLLPRAVRNASVVVAVSQATKSDIIKHIRIPMHKIAVIYEGANPSFHPRSDGDRKIGEVRALYGVGERPYFLCLGASDPKKNAPAVIRAFSKMVMRVKSECALLMAGGAGKGRSSLESLSRELGVRDRVVLAGFVPDEHLPLLMSGARGLCFPSLYEGFGLPVLEAMACGCPVITSDVSSLPEVAGGAALLVDPRDAAQLSLAMERLLTDGTLREDLRARGISRARDFSWENAASRLLELLAGAVV